MRQSVVGDDVFGGIFSESSNTTGCRFGYNLGRGGVQHASLQLAFEVKMAQKQLQVGDMVGVAVNFSQKKTQKSGTDFQKFGNIPDEDKLARFSCS